MAIHEHKYECSDIPAVFFCKCGAEMRYDSEQNDYVRIIK